MSAADASADAAARVPRPAVFSPLYRQIKDLLLKSLDAGEWKPGELIPSEIELATRFQVSQGTVRKAVDELAAENLLVRRQGKGTFVATHHEPRAQFRFLRVTPDEGEPAPPQSRFLECRRLRAPAEIARQLELRTGDAVVYPRRLLSFGFMARANQNGLVGHELDIYQRVRAPASRRPQIFRRRDVSLGEQSFVF